MEWVDVWCHCVHMERMMSSLGVNQLLIHSMMEFTCAMRRNYSYGVGGDCCFSVHQIKLGSFRIKLVHESI